MRRENSQPWIADGRVNPNGCSQGARNSRRLGRMLWALLMLSGFALSCGEGMDGPTPRLTSVEPSTVATAFADATVTLHGSGFSPVVVGALGDHPAVEMPAVYLIAPGGVRTQVPVANVSFPSGDNSGTQLVVVIPMGLVAPFAPGEPDVAYDIEVVNPNGEHDILEGALTITAPSFFDLVSIDPPFGCTCERTTVTLTSDGAFVSTPTVFLGDTADPSATRVALERVAFVDASTLTAVVPPGIPVGTYDVIVINPPSDGGTGVLESGFRVVSLPVPVVVAVVPGRGNTQDDTPVTLFGANFRAPLRIELLDRTENVVVTVNGAVVSDSEATATFPTTTMSAAPYLVRVINEDEETYFTFSGFLVTNPSGNLENFVTESGLTTARRLLTGGAATDDLGNRYLYAIGGDTGAGGTVLDTIERVQLSKFGALGQWSEQRNRLLTPRTGASAVFVPLYTAQSPFVPAKNFLYVTGGLDDNGQVLDSVERALMLSSADAPRITHIDPADTGSLGAGTWYYKVSAILSSADPDNPGGETMASDEAILTLSSGGVTLEWEAIQVGGLDAAGYRIYRTDEANGASQQERLIAEVDGATLTYTDEGDAPGDAAAHRPLGPGDTGVFVLDDQALTQARWGHQTLLMRDGLGARSLLVVGGKSAESGGVLDSVEVSDLDLLGQLSTPFSTMGTTPMNEARAFFAAAVETSDNVSTYASSGSRLWVAGGVGSTGAILDTLEESDFEGTNGAWTTNGKKAGRTAGGMAVIVNEKLFLLGGATAGTDTDLNSVVGTGRDTEFDNSGEISGSINSTSSSLLAPRALGIGIAGAGFIYFIGGSSTGANALSTVERTF
ncbi:MAG: hypothetical protein COW42_05225 [Deltaproteobacteria bacterium CG17_big_fil_post_rev_8_21_14_2_50_63_7]|nr:MAG: hypothetical protein COW42_05225 [Deltaproteobacteria bacterium CG17_big_fil_post_rev_8_21_14_2_50_63_7]